jgi:hypothetical protein
VRRSLADSEHGVNESFPLGRYKINGGTSQDGLRPPGQVSFPSTSEAQSSIQSSGACLGRSAFIQGTHVLRESAH